MASRIVILCFTATVTVSKKNFEAIKKTLILLNVKLNTQNYIQKYMHAHACAISMLMK